MHYLRLEVCHALGKGLEQDELEVRLRRPDEADGVRVPGLAFELDVAAASFRERLGGLHDEVAGPLPAGSSGCSRQC